VEGVTWTTSSPARKRRIDKRTENRSRDFAHFESTGFITANANSGKPQRPYLSSLPNLMDIPSFPGIPTN
jgi:hypothetical protein